MQTKVLLSIKPEFAYKILEGVKKYEFRRSIFKDSNIKNVIIYASSPERKVVGEFEIDGILFEELNSLWHKTKKYSGIDESYFFDYFSDKEKGYAIKVKKIQKYERPLELNEIYSSCPPQSFAYLTV